MLRQLSLAALHVLAEMHKIYGDKVRHPGMPSMTESLPQINNDEIIKRISDKFHPYLIESAIAEMKSVGLFSHFIEWIQTDRGKFRSGSYYSGETVAYTDFTFNFVEFITQ